MRAGLRFRGIKCANHREATVPIERGSGAVGEGMHACGSAVMMPVPTLQLCNGCRLPSMARLLLCNAHQYVSQSPHKAGDAHGPNYSDSDQGTNLHCITPGPRCYP